MNIVVTKADALKFMSEWYIRGTEPMATEARKRQILPIVEFNIMASGLRLATILIVASAVFSSISLLVLGGFLWTVTQMEVAVRSLSIVKPAGWEESGLSCHFLLNLFPKTIPLPAVGA